MSAAPAPGTILGSYVLERMLGRGGMGVVFLAYDNTLQRRVALKVLNADGAEAARSQLLREARSAAALNHPSICHVYEVGEANGAAFIAMEHIEGHPLNDLIGSQPLPMATLLRYGHQLADALAFAHEHGVVHRDFKAANIIVTPQGLLKIIDFGLARRVVANADGASTIATAVPQGSTAGTPYAMAPEQVRGEYADARSDIWALGVLLYEMAGGAKPFRGASAAELFSSILRDTPPRLDDGVPAALRAVIDRCLMKDPADRFPRAADVRVALEAMQDGQAVAAARWPAVARRWAVAAAAVVALAAAGFAPWAWSRFHDLTSPPPLRLAVLPFTDLAAEPDQAYFSEGLTDETIAELGRINAQRLQVLSRTTSMHYRNAALPLKDIGRELDVAYLLEGSTRREGNRVRIVARLVQASDEAQRWSGTFERESADVLALQSDIAKGVAEALSVALLPESRARLDAMPQVNAQAYDYVLRGRSHSAKLTRGDLDVALKYFQSALDLNPDFAPAVLGIARVWSGRQQMGFAIPADAQPPMKAALARALVLDDSSSDAHLGQAITYTWTDWRFADAEREFQRAITLGPNNSEAHAFYGHYLYVMHRRAEGEREMRRALELDPLSELIQALYGTTLLWNGRNEEALANAKNILKTTPDSNQALNQTSIALHNLGRLDDSVAAEIQWARARGDTVLATAMATAAAEGGYVLAMQREGDVLAARAEQRGGAPNRIATAYLRAGQYDKAIDWLEKGLAAREPNMPYINTGPQYDPVRSMPRFKALVRRMQLPE